MSTLVDRIVEARRTGQWQPVVAAIPYAQFLGLEVVGTAPDLLCCLRYAPPLIGNSGIPALHGGTVGTLLETTAIFRLLFDGEGTTLPRTINFTVDYLAAAHAVDTFARGTITRLGRRVANVHVTAWQADATRPVAQASVHLLLSEDS